VAPVQVAVLPLVKKLNEKAEPLYRDLKRRVRAEYDDGGTIGKRYRRQDEIGTPFCVTLDFDSLEDQAVTVRHRDSMTQERVALDQVANYLETRLRPAG
jgi:glycyl-tRNA synthetase